MKTTIDLPDALVKQLKLRALKDGRKLKDAVADLLRVGLAAPVAGASKDPQLDITKDRKTGLPVIRCPRIARRGEELTPERVANILNDQEGEWVRESA